MIGSFITRGLVMVLGYAYPAYECYKTVEMNKPDIEQLRFWCQYWILVAVLTVSERIGDAFISWVPMYSEAKLAFFIYLWYPKTKGTTYVYDSFFRPYVAKHETEIDRNLLELKTRAGDIVALYWQRAASYGQTKVFDILQYIASQSTPQRRPVQPQQQGARARQNSAGVNRKPVATAQPQTTEPTSPTSSASSDDLKGVEEVAGPSKSPRANLPGPVLNTQKTSADQPPQAPVLASQKSNAGLAVTATQATTTLQASTGNTSQPATTEAAAMQIEPVSPAKENENPPPKESVMDEAVRVTRGRLRKARSIANR